MGRMLANMKADSISPELVDREDRLGQESQQDFAMERLP